MWRASAPTALISFAPPRAPVVGAHEHDISGACDERSIVHAERALVAPLHERAAVKEHHHRHLCPFCKNGRKHIDIQAVRALVGWNVWVVVRLEAPSAPCRAVHDICPRRTRRPRRPPLICAASIVGKGNSKELPKVLAHVARAQHLAALECHNVRLGLCKSGCKTRRETRREKHSNCATQRHYGSQQAELASFSAPQSRSSLSKQTTTF